MEGSDGGEERGIGEFVLRKCHVAYCIFIADMMRLAYFIAVYMDI